MSVEGVHQLPPTRPAHGVTRRQALGTLAACLMSCPVAAALGPAEFRLATFAADVTPPLGHPLMGGGIVPAREVLDPLSAMGFVLLGVGRSVVLAAIDWCEIHNGHTIDVPVLDLGSAQLDGLPEDGMSAANRLPTRDDPRSGFTATGPAVAAPGRRRP
jgi:hypothetical protein